MTLPISHLFMGTPTSTPLRRMVDVELLSSGKKEVQISHLIISITDHHFIVDPLIIGIK